MSVEHEIVHMVYYNGHPLCVAPWAETGEDVCLSNGNIESSREYWGEVEIVLPPEYAIELGKALIACADRLSSQDSEND